MSANSRIAIDVSMLVDPLLETIDYAIPIGLVVNELVSNSLEHGFCNRESGTISVACHRLGDGRLELIVKDDGIGLPHGSEQPEGFGLNIVRTLVELQLQGTLELSNAAGVTARVCFDDHGYEERV
jgi:two-component sensor histidine kinase